MFRDDQQRAAVCQVLCARVGRQPLWTLTGPTTAAEELLKAGGGPLSHGEKVMLFVAWALWMGRVSSP